MTSILSDTLAPPRIGDERPLGVAERLAEVLELLLHQQAAPPAARERAARCARPTRARGAPRRTRRSRRRRRASASAVAKAASFFSSSAWKRRFSSSTTREPPWPARPRMAARAGSPMQSAANVTSAAEQRREARGHRLRG